MRINSALLITILLIAFSFLLPKGFAQTESQISKVSAGITPDNFLYGLDVTLDKISLLLTFDNTAKAKKALEIAQERLLEVKQMTLENKLDAAQIAEKEHADTIETAKSAIKNIQNSNKTEELREEVEVEKELEEHENEVQKVMGEVKVKIEINGNITSDQQVLVESILKILENNTGQVKVVIEDEKNSTKNELKEANNIDDEEANNVENELEQEEGLTDVQKGKAKEVISDVKQNLEKLKKDLNKVNISDVRNSVSQLLNNAESHLSAAQTAYNQTEYEKAYSQAKSADKLLENAKNQLEKVLGSQNLNEEKLKIRVEIKNNQAFAKIERGGENFKFTLDTTDKEKIISEIVNRTGITRSEVEKVLKFKIEEPNKSLEEKIHEIEKEEEGKSEGD